MLETIDAYMHMRKEPAFKDLNNCALFLKTVGARLNSSHIYRYLNSLESNKEVLAAGKTFIVLFDSRAAAAEGYRLIRDKIGQPGKSS